MMGVQEWACRAGLSVEQLEAEMAVGKRAVQHLVRSNIRLVLSIARKYRSEFVDYSDLIQVATYRPHHQPAGRPVDVRRLTVCVLVGVAVAGGHAGAAPRREEVRPAPRLQVRHLRHLVDPAGHAQVRRTPSLRSSSRRFIRGRSTVGLVMAER